MDWNFISCLIFQCLFPRHLIATRQQHYSESCTKLGGKCSSSQWKTFKWREDSKLPGTERNGGCLTMEIQQNLAVPARHKSCLTGTYNVRTGDEGEKKKFAESLHKKTKRKERGYTASPWKPQFILSSYTRVKRWKLLQKNLGLKIQCNF